MSDIDTTIKLTKKLYHPNSYYVLVSIVMRGWVVWLFCSEIIAESNNVVDVLMSG